MMKQVQLPLESLSVEQIQYFVLWLYIRHFIIAALDDFK